jgi:hypothetical protein
MGNFVFQDLENFPKTVWREGDPPLVNGTGPVIEHKTPEPSARPGGARQLLWLGVIACIVIGARLVSVLITDMLYTPLPPVNEDVAYRTPIVVVAVGIWLSICLLAIVRASRRIQ